MPGIGAQNVATRAKRPKIREGVGAPFATLDVVNVTPIEENLGLATNALSRVALPDQFSGFYPEFARLSFFWHKEKPRLAKPCLALPGRNQTCLTEPRRNTPGRAGLYYNSITRNESNVNRP